MIPAPSVEYADFKNCCTMPSRHDGAKRKDYFQGVSHDSSL
jgi:hypothetical protein